MKRLFIACLLVPIVALANWDANSWPAHENTRSSHVWIAECQASFLEKVDQNATIASLLENLPRDTPGGSPNGSWSFLYVIKDLISDDLDETLAQTQDNARWVDTAISGSGTNAPGYLTNSAAYPPILTSASVLTNCNLPDNFWTYTPVRCLSGLGPFTNGADFAAIGHKHGWTNATTAAAGAATLPAGRTVWYTTDYGWDGIRAVLDQMTMHYVSSYSVAAGDMYLDWTSLTNASRIGDDTGNASWNDAKTAAGAEFDGTNTTATGPPTQYTYGLVDGSGLFDALLLSIANINLITNIFTQSASVADFYWLGDNNDGEDISTFDAGTVNVASNIFVLYFAGSSSTNSYRQTAACGNNDKMNWTAQPSVTNSSYWNGWVIDASYWLIDYTFTYTE